MKKHLAILATHPIQYHAAWFRALASCPELELEVLFCHKATPREQAAAGFGIEFDWDVSLLDGYAHRFLTNVASQPNVNGFAGLDTPEIAEIISRQGFNAVMVNGWNYKSAWQAMRSCWRTRTPVLARSDSHLLTERNFTKRVAKWPLYKWFIPKLDACLPVGEWSRDYFLHYGARPEKLFIVPHAVDQSYFESQSARWSPTRAELRAEWGIDQETTVFLFVGKFIEKKRPLDFLRAINQAAKDGEKLCGLMVGDGPLRSECETFVSGANAPVRFAGFINQSEIVKAYVAADALVLPSDGGETWGMVVNEAMASGKPCLVSDRVGCGPDLIVSGETGEIFPVGDIQSLASLLASYSRHPERLPEMGAKVERQLSGYSIGAAVDGVVRAIDSVSNRSAK